MERILSVGIDIGTSTTQLIFSRITMENTGGYFAAPRVSIVGKEVIYKSEVHTTPLYSLERINGEAVRQIVEAEYGKAAVRPDEVNTGAVIITGESARKENAAEVLHALSDFAGEFVVSTAGPDLESIIAGKGSGAYRYSLENHCVTVNFDIGGGTTNIVVFDDGEVAGKGCFDIGGRLIRVDGDWNVDYLSDAAKRVADAAGVEIRAGGKTDADILKKICDRMAAVLDAALQTDAPDPLVSALQTAGSTPLTLPDKRIERICFSGGVADFLKEDAARRDPVPYGDIGALLGQAVFESALYQRFPVMNSRETIRATVVGAGTYTTTISGSTITYASELFPVKNIPALKLTQTEQEECFHALPGALKEKVKWFLAQSDADNLMLSLPGKRDPAYPEIRTLAGYLAKEMDEALPDGLPFYIVIEQDMGKALGVLLEKELQGRRKIACIDGIHVDQGDYVDMGRPLVGGLVIPVVVKTLLFG